MLRGAKTESGEEEMAEEEERTINAIMATEVGPVVPQDDGTVLVVLKHEGGEFGVLLKPEFADELTGALIECPQSGHHAAFGSGEEHVVDVSEHLVEQVDSDAYVFQIASETGTKLTFRMGTRRLRRIRDGMTAQLARKQMKARQ